MKATVVISTKVIEDNSRTKVMEDSSSPPCLKSPATVLSLLPAVEVNSMTL